MTPLADVYALYSKYAFHPPQCPVLSYDEFVAMIRDTGNVQTAAEEAEDEPLWTQPCSLVLRDDIPLDAWKPTAESPAKPKASKPPKQETITLLQASFRFDPSPGMDADAYFAAVNTETTNASTRGANYKEHDMIWRSVGLNFARWVKAEKAKKRPKVESGAGEAERPAKRRKAEERSTVQSGTGAPYTEPSAARASVLVRPVEQVTPEQRRRQVMAMWYVFSLQRIPYLLGLTTFAQAYRQLRSPFRSKPPDRTKSPLGCILDPSRSPSAAMGK